MRARRVVLIQELSILGALKCGRYQDTRSIADVLPWSVSTCWHRLRDLERQGRVEKKTPRSYVRPNEVFWRLPTGDDQK